MTNCLLKESRLCSIELWVCRGGKGRVLVDFLRRIRSVSILGLLVAMGVCWFVESLCEEFVGLVLLKLFCFSFLIHN